MSRTWVTWYSIFNNTAQMAKLRHQIKHCNFNVIHFRMLWYHLCHNHQAGKLFQNRFFRGATKKYFGNIKVIQFKVLNYIVNQFKQEVGKCWNLGRGGDFFGNQVWTGTITWEHPPPQLCTDRQARLKTLPSRTILYAAMNSSEFSTFVYRLLSKQFQHAYY